LNSKGTLLARVVDGKRLVISGTVSVNAARNSLANAATPGDLSRVK
jgi:hypothetical protein